MKKITFVSSFTLVLAISAIAGADAPAPSTPRPAVPPPPFATLPSGSMTTPPKSTAPARIPKAEKIEGFYVADPPKERRDDGKITSVQIFSKEEDAKSYTAGKWFSSGRGNDESVCFSQPPRFRFRSADDEPSTEWGFEMEPTANIHAMTKPSPPRKKGETTKVLTSPDVETMEVTAIHQERFVQEDKKARVEIVDAWVDPVTHGVRLISKSTMPLERIGSAWRGVKLYAARGDKVLHVVARRDKPPEAKVDPASKTLAFKFVSALRQPLNVETPSGDSDQTHCWFAHVALKAQPGTAETAMFETNTVFVDPPEPKPAKESDDDAAGGRRRRHDDEEPGLRVRPFRATVSSTWSSKDKAPLISVSFGWSGREREL